jgi:actin-like ATPase involved in cell morphogenesis
VLRLMDPLVGDMIVGHVAGPGRVGLVLGYRLGVDLGTTYTSAAVLVGEWPSMVGLGTRAMQVPSVVFLRADGSFLVGEAAERRGFDEPGRVAREFKRRLGDEVPLMVGGSPQSPQALQARLLSWVVDTVSERQGARPEQITLTHPANWGPYKRDLLDQAIRLADLTGVETCTEPEAAAVLYASRNVLAEGDCIAVYDLGGGTFDAALLRRTADGFVLLGNPEGIEHLGGMDFDAAVFEHVISCLDDRLTTLAESEELTAGLARLRRDCVEAKEALSSDTDTVVHVGLPGLSTSVRLNREEFEAMIAPTIDDTIKAMRRALRSADLEPDQLTAIVMTGGSSRIPLVTHTLHTAFGRPLALDTHPKHDVALGATLIPRHRQQIATSPSVNRPQRASSHVTEADGVPAAPVDAPTRSAAPSALPAVGASSNGHPQQDTPPRTSASASSDGSGALSQRRVVTGAAIAWFAAGLITFAALFTTWFIDEGKYSVSTWGNVSSGGQPMSNHVVRLGVPLLLGSALLLMAGGFAIRREPLLEKYAGLTGTSAVLAVGIYMTVFDVTSGSSWFEGTVEESNTWLLVLLASLIALGCTRWVLKAGGAESQATVRRRPPLGMTGPGRTRGFLAPWVGCAVLVVLLGCASVFFDYYSVSGSDDFGPSGYLLEHFDDNNFSPGLTWGLLLVPSGFLILWGLLNQLRTNPTPYGLWMGSFLGLSMATMVALILVLEMQAYRSTGGEHVPGPGFYGFTAAGLFALLGMVALAPVLRDRTPSRQDAK